VLDGKSDQVRRLRSQIAALEELLLVQERTVQEQASRLEQLIEDSQRTKRHLTAQYDSARALDESATVSQGDATDPSRNGAPMAPLVGAHGRTPSRPSTPLPYQEGT
jgi:TolA-binding protein